MLFIIINFNVMKDLKDSVELGVVEDYGGIFIICGGGNKRNWNNI